jgi:hypothetical protein
MDLNRDLDTKDAYCSYLLRVWRLGKIEGSSPLKEKLWRVSLESIQTRQQINFASLEEMLIFLQGQFFHIDETSDEA